MAEYSEEKSEKSAADVSAEDKKLLQEARERFDLCVHEAKYRPGQLEDLKFLVKSDEQWDAKLKEARKARGLPCISVNRTKQYVRQVTNTARQNPVSMKVSPVDDAADIDTAKVQNGILRHIEVASNAKVAYERADFYASAIGEGYVKLIPEYCDPGSWDQEVRIKRIDNPFQVYFDPASMEPDGSDACFAFETVNLSKTEYKAQFPKSKLAEAPDWKGAGDAAPGWVTDDGCRIVEYVYKEYKADVLYEVERMAVEPLTGGITPSTESLLKSELPDGKLPQGSRVIRQRPVQKPTVKWCKLNGIEVLEKTTLPGSGRWINYIKFTGEDFNIDGERVVQGIVRDLKAPQQRYNLLISRELEAIALTPKAPYVAAAGQIEKYRKLWEQANVEALSVLPYDPVDVGGSAIPPPQRQVAEPAIAAISQAMLQASVDMDEASGIHRAQLGAPSNETSGVAINARKVQGETSNFHYIDNRVISINQVCRVALDWMPKIYDRADRVIRIVGEDGSFSTETINRTVADKGQNPYQLGVGQYDVVCTAGPSFETRRQEAAANIVELVRAFPQLMQIAPDLVLKSIDGPYMQEMAERAKKAVPAEFQDKPEGEKDIPPEVMQKFQQLSQQLQAMNEYAKQLEAKAGEFEQKKELAIIQRDTELAKIRVKGEEDAQLATLKAELEGVHKKQDAMLGLMQQHLAPKPEPSERMPAK